MRPASRRSGEWLVEPNAKATNDTDSNRNMLGQPVKIKAHYQPVWQGIDIYIVGEGQKHGYTPIGEVTFHDKPTYAPAEPTLRVDCTVAQELMDSLWACGLRPTEGKGSAGALAATQHHLDDMRKIVANQLGIEFDGNARR